MVEHSVDHHPQSARVGLVHQLLKILVGAQIRADVVVVQNVIFVVFPCDKKRVQVQAVEAKPGDVIQILRNAPEGAAQPGMEGQPPLPGR